jgi:DNA repair protein REV1
MQFIRQMTTEVRIRLDSVNMIGRLLTLKIMKRDPIALPRPVGLWTE